MKPPLRRTWRKRYLLIVLGTFGLWFAAAFVRAALQGWERPIRSARNVLVVTAHPDDETIFFSPTILSLRRQHREVHLLCFTTGNFHGLGDTRVQELKAAAAALHVDEQHLVIVNDTRIADGKQEHWPTDIMVNIIAREVARRHIDTVITFDREGVYGHVNHAACESAVRSFAEDCMQLAMNGAATCPSTWTLYTEKSRKSLGALTFVSTASSCPREHQACYTTPSLFSTLRAMGYHASQWRWWSHVLTRSYTFVNSLDRISTSAEKHTAKQMLVLSTSQRAYHSSRKTRLLHNQGRV